MALHLVYGLLFILAAVTYTNLIKTMEKPANHRKMDDLVAPGLYLAFSPGLSVQFLDFDFQPRAVTCFPP
jgi:hypothetical protein